MKKLAGFIFIILITGHLQSFSQSDGRGRKMLPTRSEEYLDNRLAGSSSLFFWNGDLWTCNDHGELGVYSLDTLNGSIKDSVKGCLQFNDMEEMAQDEEFFYFGDFGNNHSALRNDLCIYRMAKSDLVRGVCRADTIRFTYEGYNPDGEGSSGTPVTDYDCEAMVAVGDSLYLFSKQWTSQQTVCFAVPKEPGFHTAIALFRLNVNGLVTGASYYRHSNGAGKEHSTLVLCGYNMLVQPFIYLVYDFQGSRFLEGKREKILVSNDIGWQTEAIATDDGIHYWITNESFKRLGIVRPARLISVDLSIYMESNTPTSGTTNGVEEGEARWPVLAPNPTDGMMYIMPSDPTGSNELRVEVWDTQGHRLQGAVRENSIDLRNQSAGVYLVKMSTPRGDMAIRKVQRVANSCSY